MPEEINLFNINNPNSSFELLAPYVKVTIGAIGNAGSEVFTTGDGKLISTSVTLSEGKAQSNCKFTVYDPEKRLTDKFFSYIESVGGLDPIEAPESEDKDEEEDEVVEGSTSNLGEATAGKVIFENVVASTYGWGSVYDGGDTTAYGDKIDFEALTAAMYHPSGKNFYKYAKMKVTEISSGRSIVVTVNDTGPFAIASDGKVVRPLIPHPTRKIDLTRGAWKKLTNNAPQGLTNVKIEWLEAGTVTSTTPPKDKSQSKAQASKVVKKGNISKAKIGNWPTAKVPATKKIILIPGHLVDSNGGTGSNISAVTYNGETRPAEGVATQLAVEVFASELTKAGYSVRTPTTSVRGVQVGNNLSTKSKAFLDSVAAMEKSTGAYALELHFDAPFDSKGRRAGRSGVIPERLNAESDGSSLNVMSVALGKDDAFGSFSHNHGDVFAAPRRGIAILEIDRLSPELASPLASGNWQAFKNSMIPYAQKAVRALNTVTDGILSKTNEATDSINNSKGAQQEKIAESKTLAGAQITIELGYNGKTIAASSFIHTGLSYSLFAPDQLEFSGTSAGWVLTQRIKNNVYTNLTFKKIATKVASAYGLKLDMPIDGPKYEYFPQRGQSDYEMLLIEARRIGLRMYVRGNVLHIKPRADILANKNTYVLTYGENMGINFTCDHTAQKDTKGGARSSDPGESTLTGVRKFEIDPDTGKLEQKVKENIEATGGDTADTSTTGSPAPTPAPKTDGATAKEDADRKAGENRIKGIGAKCDFPTTPEALSLDPDTLLLTKGISAFLDRTWVIVDISPG
jgi:rare lipoprotein A (peptidoglycan hydrolase)/phage protein D